MQTDKLIQSLTSDLKPVKPFKNNFLPKLFLFSIIVTGLFLLVVNVRPDLPETLRSAQFLLNLLLSSLLFIGAAHLAFKYASPGRRPALWVFPILVVILLLLLVLNMTTTAGSSSLDFIEGLGLAGLECSAMTVGIGVICATYFIWNGRKCAFTRPGLGAFLIMVSAFGVGSLAIALHCDVAHASHNLAWHFLVPLLSLGLVGSILGRRFLRW